ncbi:MAG: mandelate racemase/muconate lactonizing enzyme family protein [Chloroflexi bacterium]|nr:mandelate racemase/muconate lactonizing enzyme family protein [Chloroflexota bacterium]
MKITAVECLVLDETYPFVMIRTDEGITGYGETFRRGPYVQKAAIDTIFEPLLIGRDPFDTEALWREMFKAGSVAGPSGALQTAAAAVDIALWDIKGKALGVPLYRLLGGKSRDRVRVYASSLRRDLSAVEEAKRAAKFQEQGFTAYKMHSAVPGAVDHPDDRTIEHVREMRRATGDDFEILVDVNGAYSVHHAIEIGKALEDLGAFHFEQPVPVTNLEGMAAVADALTIPVAAGETSYTRWEFLELVTRGRPDIVQPDVVKCGGISELINIAALISSYGLPMTVHNTQPIISTAAHLHWIAGRNDVPYAQEYNIEPISIRDDRPILKEPLPVIDGYIEIPEKPGLGLEFDEAAMRWWSENKGEPGHQN